MSRLLILNNVFALSVVESEYHEILYAPIYQSPQQKKVRLEEFKSLRQKFKRINWCEEFELKQDDKVLAWDSYIEKKAFKHHLLPIQNRLFHTLNFKFGEGFTSFRKKAEPHLPTYYNDALRPVSDLVLKEIEYYFNTKKLATNYFETRNGLVGRDFSTKLSRFLSSGLLDVRYLYNCVKDFENENGSNKSTYWIIFELLWREFFYWHYQKHTTRYFSENGVKGEKDFSNFKKYSFEELRSLTDHKLFNAALNELEETGFHSNRVRQIFASVWINDLKLNWRSGADFYETYLIDYDVYSNYGNWQYLAGIGVDPRGKRYFDVEKQLAIYDPEETYFKKWL
jgi:deoxyribodipyrimidine photolyase